MEVLGFDIKAFENTKIKNWAKFISADMIDDYVVFYDRLCKEHPGLISFKHRYLFHWGYDAEPWSKDIEEKVRRRCEERHLKTDSVISVVKKELIEEQRKRNRKIDKSTQELFGFASGGKDREISHFFSSTAYDIHILGDYMSDNADLNGLCPFRDLVGLIIKEINKIDQREGKKVVRGINRAINSRNDVKLQADILMAYLKESIPPFIRKAQNGTIYRRLEKKGWKFLPY
jgi:hypothetical protein